MNQNIQYNQVNDSQMKLEHSEKEVKTTQAQKYSEKMNLQENHNVDRYLVKNQKNQAVTQIELKKQKNR